MVPSTTAGDSGPQEVDLPQSSSENRQGLRPRTHHWLPQQTIRCLNVQDSLGPVPGSIFENF